MSPSPFDLVRARTIGNWHFSAVKPAEFRNPFIESDGTPTWNFGRVYWPRLLTRGSSSWIAEPIQVELADAVKVRVVAAGSDCAEAPAAILWWARGSALSGTTSSRSCAPQGSVRPASDSPINVSSGARNDDTEILACLNSNVSVNSNLTLSRTTGKYPIG